MKWLLSLLLLLVLAACAPPETGSTTTGAPSLTTLPPLGNAATGSQPTPTMPPAAPPDLCESFADPIVTGVVAIDAVIETSGIATSRRHADTLWMHNDSGGGPFVYATDLSGADRGTFEIDAPAFDWEDMAIGPGPDPDTDYLYLGDIGDNFHFRPVVTVYRIREPVPDAAGGFIGEVESFDLAYPDPGYDSEAMFIDPVTADLFLVTKADRNDAAIIFRASAGALTTGQTIELAEVGRFNPEQGALVTGADIDATGAAVLFRGLNQVWLWRRTDLEFVETFAAEPCRTPSTAEFQGEAIAFTPEGFSYYTISEGQSPDINFVVSRAGA